MTGPPTIFGSSAFGRLLVERPLVALDIGARRGFVDDLLPIAAAVDAIGFEPDSDECECLNRTAQNQSGPRRSPRFIPAALAKEPGQRDLHITRRGGASSMLTAIPGVGARYMRDDYFTVERTVKIDTLILDEVLVRFQIGSPTYIKVDVEGMEREIFDGSAGALNHVLAVRTEVAFLRTRHNQPFHHEIDALLQDHRLLPFGFLELHDWRRTTKRKHPLAGKRSLPYSRGRLVHGDVIYLRDAETMGRVGRGGCRSYGATSGLGSLLRLCRRSCRHPATRPGRRSAATRGRIRAGANNRNHVAQSGGALPQTPETGALARSPECRVSQSLDPPTASDTKSCQPMSHPIPQGSTARAS